MKGIILHSSLFNDIHLVAKELNKLNNPIEFFKIKLNNLYHLFSLNIYEY